MERYREAAAPIPSRSFLSLAFPSANNQAEPKRWTFLR